MSDETENDKMDEEGNIKEEIETAAHGLEKFFGLPSGTTEISVKKFQSKIEESEIYDSKDREIEKELKLVYDKAISGYINLEDTIKTAPPKLKARLAEVALMYLNTSLNTTANKLKQKEHKDKLEYRKNSEGSRGGVKNNILIADRNALLAELLKQDNEEKEREKDSDAIPAETIEEEK